MRMTKTNRILVYLWNAENQNAPKINDAVRNFETKIPKEARVYTCKPISEEVNVMMNKILKQPSLAICTNPDHTFDRRSNISLVISHFAESRFAECLSIRLKCTVIEYTQPNTKP